MDTGADISLCKQIDILDNINTFDNCKLSGISNESTNSLGSVNMQLSIFEKSFSHSIQIVDNNFPIKTDGIIGRDILNRFLAKIDYETFTITLVIENEEFTIPMKSKVCKDFYLTIPKRSQVIHQINLNINEDSLVLNKELQKGIFLSNCIVPKEGLSHVKILNTTDVDVQLKNIEFDIEPISNYVCLTNKKSNISTQRFQRILETINIDSIDDRAKDSLYSILEDYSDIFHIDNDQITANNFYTQNLKVSDKSPVYIKNYRLPEAQFSEINDQVQKLLDDDIIENSVSAYNSPLLVVPKKSEGDKKKWRLVVDYRQLNKKIINDKFPLTRIEDVLDKLGRAKYFSTLDMTSSFHQIMLDEESRHYTAFSTSNGHYQFKRLPFGLKISSNSFQRMLTIALSGLDSEAFLYVDDIIIFGCSLTHHNNNLIKVFQRLKKYNLKLNASKCVFLKSEVVYLGHLITKDGIKTDPAKHKAIRDYPIPTNADEVKCFVAFCNYYRRFIANFADIAKCLNNLLKKGAVFDWTAECQNAFEDLKIKLISPPVLQYPDFERTFVLTTDASQYALGAVLSQGEIGKDLPISYASKCLGKHDLNKSVIEKELLAIHWSINFFRPYLYGRRFTVVTDHRPLISLFSHKNPSSKLTRIRLDLCDYDFEIVYKKGKMNTNADALSRIKIDSDILQNMIPPCNDEGISTKLLPVTRSMAKDTIKSDCVFNPKRHELHIWECTSISEVNNARVMTFSKDIELGRINKNKDDFIMGIDDNPTCLDMIMEKLIIYMHKYSIRDLAISTKDIIFTYVSMKKFQETYTKLYSKLFKRLKNLYLNILIYTPLQRIFDKNIQCQLIKEYHDSPIGGHLGIRKTILKLKQKYVWKNMSKMVKTHVNKCDSCKRNKQVRNIKEEMRITDTPNESFEVISIDTVGPLRLSNNYRYILTLQCDLTKYVIAFPMETKEARSIAKVLVEQCILKFGCFKVLKSDRGTEFANELLNEICKLLDIEQIFSTPYHHQTMGSIERNHRVLNEYLLNFVQDDEWDKWIPYYAFAYNTTPHVDTGYTPFELIYGRIVRFPIDKIINSKTIYNLDDYCNEFKARIKFSLDKAKKLLEIAKAKRKLTYDKKINTANFKIGDLVLIKYETRRKNVSPYHGPYKIIKTLEENSILDINGKEKTYHNNSLKLYFQ